MYTLQHSSKRKLLHGPSGDLWIYSETIEKQAEEAKKSTKLKTGNQQRKQMKPNDSLKISTKLVNF